MDRPSPPTVAVALALVAGLAVAVGLTAGVVSSVNTPGSPSALDTADETAPSPSSATAVTTQDPPYLSPPASSVTRQEHTQVGIDVSAAVAADAQRLHGRHETAVFEQRFNTATNQSAFVESAIGDIGSRAEPLDDQHAQAVAAYRDGELSIHGLVRELARLEAAATAHQRFADRVGSAANTVGGVDLSQLFQEQLSELNVAIPALESPVIDTLRAGEFEPHTTLYAQAGADAVVLAVANETHIQRQATLQGERNWSNSNQFTENADENEEPNGLALQRAQALYGEDNVRGFFPPPYAATTVYGVQGNTPSGSFVAYLDGTTRNIFHEQQTIAADGVTRTDTLVDAAGDLELTVNTTVPTGPMRVSVTNGGDPVEGVTLAVDDQAVGATDADGQRLVVQPLAGATVDVTVANETLSVTLP